VRASQAVPPEDWRPVATMGLAFLAVMPMAVWLAAPFQAEAPEVPQDPTSGGNAALLVLGSVVFVALAIGMAVLVLWAMRTGRHKIVQGIVLGGVAVAILVVLARPVLVLARYFGADLAWLLGLAVAAGVAAVLYRRPSWAVLNAVGIVMAAGVAGLTGAVLGVTPLLFLLVAVAVYDQVAVKRTKHMQKLARAATDLRLPIALRFGGPARPVAKRAAVSGGSAPAAPRPPSASAGPRPAAAPPAEPPLPRPPRRQAPPMSLLMGIGDLVFPTALVVAAADPQHAWGWGPAVVAGLGVLAGYALVVRAAVKGDAQPGLPLLNAGAILGFFAGLVAATGSARFW